MSDLPKVLVRDDGEEFSLDSSRMFTPYKYTFESEMTFIEWE